MNYNWLKNNLIPALTWAGFHLALSSWQFNFFGFLIGTRALVVFICLLTREEPKAIGSRGQSILAWVSTLLPTLMIWQSTKSEFLLAGELLAIVGMVLFIWTCADLAKLSEFHRRFERELMRGYTVSLKIQCTFLTSSSN